MIVISGMGGAKIKEILERSPTVLDEVSCLILQPQRGSGIVRKWLFDHNWVITDEDLVLEKDQFYEIIVAEQPTAQNPSMRLMMMHFLILDHFLSKKTPSLDTVS